MTEKPLPFVCAVCGRVLERVSDEERGGETVGWVHPYSIRAGLIGEREDHVAVPVPYADLPHPDTRCDFCYEVGPQWVVPANDFVDVDMIQDLTLPNQPTVASAGDWAACDACADLISKGRWEFVINRVKRGWRARHGSPMVPLVEQHLRRQYKELRKQITGPPYRLGEK